MDAVKESVRKLLKKGDALDAVRRAVFNAAAQNGCNPSQCSDIEERAITLLTEMAEVGAAPDEDDNSPSELDIDPVTHPSYQTPVPSTQEADQSAESTNTDDAGDGSDNNL